MERQEEPVFPFLGESAPALRCACGDSVVVMVVVDWVGWLEGEN